MTNKNENLETGFKTASIEHFEDNETEKEEKGFILIDKAETEKINTASRKADDAKTDHSVDQEGRYKFYADKKIAEKRKHPIFRRYKFHASERIFGKHLTLISKKDVEDAKKYFLDYESEKEITPEHKKEDLKDEKFIEEMGEIKKRIINFGKKIGLPDLKECLVDSSKIYLLPEKIVKEILKSEGVAFHHLNEIVVSKDEKSEIEYYNTQHELLHSACAIRCLLKRAGRKDTVVDNISSGYTSNVENNDTTNQTYGVENSMKLELADEAFTEITNQQLYFENNRDLPCYSYLEHVILVTEIVKDITQKIKEKSKETEKENSEEKIREFIESIPQKLNGEKRELTKEELKNIAENLTEEEVLAHFQRGMFRGDRRYLKIIKDYYGAEAINNLIDMKRSRKDVSRVAKIFGLQTVIDKINEFDKKSSVEIDIGKYSYRLTIIKALEDKYFIAKTRGPKN